MTTNHWFMEDARVAAVARLIGDYRNAPNLWLARRIIEEIAGVAGTTGTGPLDSGTALPDDCRESIPFR
jgi:hypothetical protein